MHILRAELDKVIGRRVVVEIYLEVDVVDAGVVGHAHLFLALRLFLLEVVDVGQIYIHFVVVVGQRGVCKQLAAEGVVPAQRRHGVAPVHIDVGLFRAYNVGILAVIVIIVVVVAVIVVVVYQEPVAAVVDTGNDTVFVAELMGNLAVEVVEIVVGGNVERPQHRSEQERVQHAPAHAERCLILDDRTFQMDPVGEHSYADQAVELLHIAVVGTDVYHGREATAVPGRERTLEQSYFLDRLRSEDGEDAEHMVDTVKRDVVQQNQVLVGAAAAHVDAGRTGGTALHARQELQRLEHILLSEQRRHTLQHVLRHLQGAGVGGVQASLLAGGNYRLLDYGRRLQADVDHRVTGQIQRLCLLCIADIRPGQGPLSRRQAQGIESVIVGYGAHQGRTGRGVVVNHTRPYQDFSAFGIRNVAAHGNFLRKRRRRQYSGQQDTQYLFHTKSKCSAAANLTTALQSPDLREW